MNSTFDNLNRLHDLARCRADALRREAMVNFWRGARRLADRLSRRARGRRASTSISAPIPTPTLSSGV